jgi:pyruvate-ferredoxin/flavodoxin oxidoreductase
VCIHTFNAFYLGNPLAGLEDDGFLFLQTPARGERALDQIPDKAMEAILRRRIHVFALDTAAIAREEAPRPDLVQRMQGIALLGVFLRITPFAERHSLPPDRLVSAVEHTLKKYFGRRGDEAVKANLACARRGYKEVVEVLSPRAIVAHEGAAAGGGI